MDNESYVHDHAVEDAKAQSTVEHFSDKPSISSQKNLKCIFAQCFATFVNSLTYISLGLMYTIPAVVIGKVENAPSGLSLNEEQASWYASFLPIAQPFSCLLGGFLQNYIGRKHGLLLMNVSTIVTWVLLYKATSVQILYLSSILMGISIGFAEVPSITYVCEIATPELRGSLTTYHTAKVVFGLILTFLLTSFVSWRTACLYCMGLSVLSALLLFFIPDSPIWLINKGRTADATRALQWLRGWVPEAQVIPELKELSQHIQGAAVKQNIEGSSTAQKLKMKDLFAADTLRPFIFLLWFSFFGMGATGLGAKNYYIIIFDRLNLSMDSNLLCLINGGAMLAGSFVCFSTVKVCGKRLLALVSMITTSILTLFLGFYIMFESPFHFPSVFITMFILLGFTQTIGIFCTIPWVMLGEVYPVKTRSIATGTTGAAFYVLMFVYFKTYYYLEVWLTTQGTFILYGVIGILGFVYLWMFMPETEGKTLAEIGQLFEDDARKSCPHFRKKKRMRSYRSPGAES